MNPITAASELMTPELRISLQEIEHGLKGAGPQSGIFTDGSAIPNPGPGGWGVVHVTNGKVVHERLGADPLTTNNRMELTALIEAMKLVGPEEAVDIYSDSELCVKSMNEWAPNWAARGWKKKGGEIKNLELVKELYGLFKARPKIKLQWIKAHNGWQWNEYADTLSTAWSRVTPRG